MRGIKPLGVVRKFAYFFFGGPLTKMLRLFADDGTVSDEKQSKRRGQRLAWVVEKGDDTEPEKTIYIKGTDYVEDDPIGDDDPEEIPEENTPYRDALLPLSFYSSMRNISEFNKDLLRRAIRARNEEMLKAAKPSKQADYLEDYYKKAEREIALQESKHFILHRDEPDTRKRKHGESEADVTGIEIIVPVPPKRPFQVCIFGPTNSGKSYWAGSTYMKAYAYYNPSRPIYVCAFGDQEDEAFDDVPNVQYLKIDESILKDPFSTSEFSECLIVFDDIESLAVNLREAVTTFRDQCLAAGRKLGISVIAIAHEIFGGLTSRSSILESEFVVLFNQGMVEPIEKMLKKKYGMSKDIIHFILNSKTRWVMLKRTFPQAIITPREIRCI